MRTLRIKRKFLPYYMQKDSSIVWYVVNEFSHQGRKFMVCVN